MSEFWAPSMNLQCEITFAATTNSAEAYCLTLSPQASATLKSDSSLVECTGSACLSNAGVNTPTLQYGTSITLGPTTCISQTTGMRCTMTNGTGFIMAKSGVTPIGTVTVRHTTTNL